MFTHCSFDATKIKLDYYREHDCIKKFCKDLKGKVMNYEKTEMILLTYEENVSSKKSVIYTKKSLLLVLRLAAKIYL